MVPILVPSFSARTSQQWSVDLDDDQTVIRRLVLMKHLASLSIRSDHTKSRFGRTVPIAKSIGIHQPLGRNRSGGTTTKWGDLVFASLAITDRRSTTSATQFHPAEGWLRLVGVLNFGLALSVWQIDNRLSSELIA